MFKKLIALLTAAVLVLCLCGCNSDNGSSSEEVEIIYEYEDGYFEEGTQSGGTSTGGSSSQGGSSTPGGSSSQGGGSSTPGGSSQGGGSSTPDAEDTDLSLADASVLSQIKFNGRPYITSKGVSLDFPASSLEFKANCSGTAYLRYDMIAANEKRFFTVYVDGAVVLNRQVIDDSGYLILAKNLSQGEHTFKVITDTDVGRGALVTFTKIGVNGNLVSNASNKPVIEFLGDSLSSGVGALCDNGAPGESGTETQSAMAAYPYLIAQELGYDYRIVSRGGIGLKASDSTPDFLDFYKSANWWRNDKSAFTAQSASDVDVVVVNLGTNDVVNYKTFDPDDGISVAAYSQYYADLITNIGYAKDTKILFVAGVGSHSNYMNAFDGAIAKLNAAGYNNVYTCKAGRYISGGVYHPTAAEQKKAANDILSALRKNGMV